ncbi:hypothetical protein GCM10023089_00330 [Quisquiliibacterium transsilvanicum]
MSRGRDTGRARLPALPPVNPQDPALRSWVSAVNERLEVREGSRGNPAERVVTWRDLEALGVDPRRLASGRLGPAGGPPFLVGGPGGTTYLTDAEAFSAAIYNSRLFQSLVKRLDDLSRFDALPEEVRRILLNEISLEAKRRGADIQRLEHKFQSETQSLAYKVEETTAAVQGSSSGVRELAFAAATEARATAGLVNQVQARLDDVGGVTIEESLIAVADRVEGLSGEYMVKINAGRAVAGVGLSASEDPDGNTESAFIVQADTFALVPTYDYAQGTAPWAIAVGETWYDTENRLSYRSTGTGTGNWALYTPVAPFGVDTTDGAIYLNGLVRINATGPTLDELASMGGIKLDYSSQYFKIDATGSPVNATITLTAVLSSGLSGYVDWSSSSGYGGTLPAAGTANTATINVADLTADAAVFTITKVDGADTYTDTVTLVKLRDGTDAVSALLTNEHVTVPANADGSSPVLTGATSSMRVYVGTVDDTANWTFTTSASPGVALSSGSATPDIVVSGLTVDSGTVTKTASKAGYSPISKVFTITKAKAGTSGTNNAVVFIYRRAASAPSKPSVASTYTFSTRSISGLNNSWTATVPAGTDPVWVSTAVASSSSDTDSIAAAEWTNPTILAQNGAVGDTGPSGLNSATVYLYQRTATDTPPALPSATTTYTFATGFVTGFNNGWARELTTTGGPYRWVIQATAASSSATDTISSGEWSEPRILAQDGSNGTAGAAGARGSLAMSAMVSGLIAYPTRVGGKARWSTSNLNEAGAVSADSAATSTICTALGVPALTSNLQIGDTVTLSSIAGGDTWLIGTPTGFTADAIRAMTYGLGVYVAAGTSGKLSTSANGSIWIARTSGFGTTAINAACFAYGLFVIGGDSGKRAWSTDGITWTATSTFDGGGTAITGIACGNEVWVAVGGTKCQVSRNGKDWEATTTPFAGAINAVAFGNGLFVAVGAAGRIYTSADGAAWTLRTSNNTDAYHAVAFGEGRFVAVGAAGKVSVSDTPTGAWAAPTSLGSMTFYACIFGNRTFVVGGSTGNLQTSPDGATWVSRSGFTGASNTIQAAAYGGVRFAAGGFAGSAGLLGYSSSQTPASVTGYWSGSAWVNPGVTIDGNLLVTGSLSAGTGNFNKVVVAYSGFYYSDSLSTNAQGFVDITFSTSGIGTPLWSWAIYTGLDDLMPVLTWIDNTATSVTFRLHIWNKATGAAYVGPVPVLKIAVF